VIGLFKQKTPANILFVFILGILLKLPVFKHSILPATNEKNGIIYDELVLYLNSFGDRSLIIYAVLTFLLLFSQALQLNKLINDHRMMQKVTYLPAASYLLMTSLFPEWNFFSAPLIVNSFVLFVFLRLFKLYNQSQVRAGIYNIGLATGLSAFIFFPSVILFVWVLLGLLVIRTFRANEWLICILGVITPFYFYFSWLLYTGTKNWTLAFTSFRLAIPDLSMTFWASVSVFLVAFPFFIGSYFVQTSLRKMLIQVRKNWSLVFIYLLFAMLIPFLNTGNTGIQNWMFITVPFAAFHACAYLYPKKSWLPLLIFWISISFVIVYQMKGPGW
jgi:hypothetical protein